MFKILEKQVLNPTVTKMVIEAPLVAKRQNRASSSFSALRKTVNACR